MSSDGTLTVCSASHHHSPPSSLQPWLTDLLSFKEDYDDKSNATIWGKQETLLVLKDWKISMGISSLVMKWQRSSELWPAPGSWSPEGCPLLLLLPLICIQHMHCTQVFKYVCYLNLCNISQIFLYENCFVVHQPLSEPSETWSSQKMSYGCSSTSLQDELLYMKASHVPSPKFSCRSWSWWIQKSF